MDSIACCSPQRPRTSSENALAAGADVSCREKVQRSPLHFAAQNGQEESIRALLDAGADVSCREKSQWTPLHLAAWTGHHGAIKALLAGGADVSGLTNTQATPLHLAAQNGHEECIKVLLAGGADVSSRNKDQWTPLHLATSEGHVDASEALLAAGADVSCREKDKWTPLHLAAWTGHLDVAEVLLTAGADTSSRSNINDLLPVDLAVIYGQLGVLSVFTRVNRIGFSAADRRTTSTLDWAVMRNQIEALKMLVNVKDIISSQNVDGWNALQTAVFYNNMRAVKIIVEAMRPSRSDSSAKWSSWNIAVAMGRSQRMLDEINKVDDNQDMNGIDEWRESCYCDEQLLVPLMQAATERTILGSGGFGVIDGVTHPNNNKLVLKFDKKVLDSMSILFETVGMKYLDHPHIVEVFGYFNDPRGHEAEKDLLDLEELSDRWNYSVQPLTAATTTTSTSEFNNHTLGASNASGAKCMVMEWMNQGSLIDWMQQNTAPITEKTVRMLMKQALEALAYLHEPVHTDPFGRKNMALVHHDIKPHNMLIHVGDDGVPVLKLADFGLSRFERHHQHIYHQSIGGTRAYLGPEALPTAKNVQYTPASDIFSWAKTFVEVGMQCIFVETATLDAVESLVTLLNFTPQAKTLIAKCMDEDPGKRPTAKVLLADDYFSKDDLFQQWFSDHSKAVPQLSVLSTPRVQ